MNACFPKDEVNNCTVCQKDLSSEHVWNCIHVGTHRETRLDICRDCDSKGYFFWNGAIWAKKGTASETEGIVPVYVRSKKR